MCALALGAAGLNLLAVIFHTRGNVKAESVVTTLESTVSDVETALPAGKAAVIAVIVKDVEAEIEKVAPNSSATAALVRLKAVLKAAGMTLVVMALFLAMSVGTVACASLGAFQGGLQIASEVASGMSSAVSAIESFIVSVAKPDAATLAKIESVVTKIRQTLAALSVALTTAKDATDANVVALLGDAQTLYTDLLQLAQPLGVTTTGALAASPSGAPTLDVPPAEAFRVAR
jgi:transcriptional regulator with XRE-family HTH domain